MRIVAEPLEAYVEGYVIDQLAEPEANKIAQSDDDRMARIRQITDEVHHLQEQKKRGAPHETTRRGRHQDVSRSDG